LLSHNPEQSKQNGGYIQFAAVGGNAEQAHVKKEVYPATFGFLRSGFCLTMRLTI
jgi:hypothetical protein